MRLIDADEIKYLYPVDEDGNEGDGMTLQSTIDEMPTVEAYTKDEVIAMFIELRSEIENLPFPQREPDYMWGYSDSRSEILDYIIEPKINELKAEQEGKHE